MSLHAQYRKDNATVWIRPTAGVEINVSHFDPRQPDYQKNLTQLTKSVRKLVEQNLLPPEKDREYAIKAFVATCVKGWRTETAPGEYRDEINVKGDDWLPFSRESAVAVFMSYPQFYSDTVELARELSAFQVSEDEVKN